MKTGRTGLTAGLCVSLLLALAAPAALAKESFTLTAAVPDDVFLCVTERHNPERKFLDDYWAEIFRAVKATGIGGDLLELLGAQLGDEEQAEVERLKELATKLLDGVNWQQLAGREFAFAERMSAPSRLGGEVNVGIPDMLWLFRGSGTGTAENYAGLVEILEAAAREINKAANEEVTVVDRSPHAGAKIATLSVHWQRSEPFPFSLAVARHEDVIVIAAGRDILHESLGLLAGTGSNKALGDSSRFRAAFTKLPPAEDTMVFFDVQTFLDSFGAIMELGLESAKPAKGGDVILNAAQNREGDELNKKAIRAYQNKDYAEALQLILQAHEAAPADSLIMYNVACFKALNGHKAEALSWLEKSVEAGFYAPKQIENDGDLVTLRDDPRYTAALAAAKEQAAAKCCSGDQELANKLKLIKRVLDVPRMFDYIASVEYTDGYATHEDTITALVPGAEQRPFYRVFGTQRPLTNYQEYLPQEAVSFSVAGAIDLNELYKFIENTIESLGAEGVKALAKWAQIQETIGFNVQRDLLSWLSGETISMTVDSSTGPQRVFMIKVTDEEAARARLDSTLKLVSGKLQEMAVQNPMLNMIAVRTSPCPHEQLVGFHNITMGMSPQPLVAGVAEGRLVIATSAEAVALSFATAAGKHPNVTKNTRVMSEAVVPEGAFRSVTFEDKRKFGQELSQLVGVISMAGGMAAMAIPEPEAQQILSKILGMVSKLAPVAMKIDFYNSSASCTTFDGQAWHTRAVTNYRTPTKTASAQQ